MYIFLLCRFKINNLRKLCMNVHLFLELLARLLTRTFCERTFRRSTGGILPICTYMVHEANELCGIELLALLTSRKILVSLWNTIHM
jgi:hypothetical protein